METGSCFDIFFFLSSLLHLFGSRPSTNSVGTGCYPVLIPMDFPHALDLVKGCLKAMPIGCGSYDLVRVCTLHE